MKKPSICPICKKPKLKKNKTCGKGSCPAILAGEERNKKAFRTEEKDVTRLFVWEEIQRKLQYKKDVFVLDFYGVGGFLTFITRKVLKEGAFGGRLYLYEIDKVKKIKDRMYKHTHDTNKKMMLKGVSFYVECFSGTFEKFVEEKEGNVKLDVSWLDYCGTADNAEKDAPALNKISKLDCTVFITLFKGHDGYNKNGREIVMDKWVKESFPHHKRDLSIDDSYKQQMGFYKYTNSEDDEESIVRAVKDKMRLRDPVLGVRVMWPVVIKEITKVDPILGEILRFSWPQSYYFRSACFERGCYDWSYCEKPNHRRGKLHRLDLTLRHKFFRQECRRQKGALLEMIKKFMGWSGDKIETRFYLKQKDISSEIKTNVASNPIIYVGKRG